MAVMGSHSFREHIRNNISVLVLCACVLLLVYAVYLLDRRWRSCQTRLEKATGVMKQSHAFSLNLVRHLLPSFKVAKYQFRGMLPAQHRISIKFNGLGLDLPNGRRVLTGVTGRFDAGRMCAIMGPSGAGKTTFLNVLCGKAHFGKTSGCMEVNGHGIKPHEMKPFMGFVPQDDIVHPDLTVREQIQFSARLRGEAHLSKDRLQRITDDVLNVMQIDSIQGSIVGNVEERGISGGQRKRVNIGLELAGCPSVLFLDEPTSGLDATSSLAIALSLSKLCQLGMTSIMVIHQPRYSLFTLFDDVLLLGKSGQTVYQGSSLHAKRYFEGVGFDMPANENPADWFVDILAGEVSNVRVCDFRPNMLSEWWQAFVESGDLEAQSGPEPQPPRCSRQLSREDDRAMLYQSLSEHWECMDVNRDGFLDSDELMVFLSRCAGAIPDCDVVCEIMGRMCGEGRQKVAKEQCLTYLCSLSGSVAHDEMLHRKDQTFPDEVSTQSTATPDGGEPAAVALCDVAMQRLSRFQQFQVVVLRTLVQWWRKNRQRCLFYSIFVFGALVLAVLDGFVDETPEWDAVSLLKLHTAFALLLSIFCLSVFAHDRLLFLRERASGIDVLAYFAAKTWVNAIDIILQTFLFTAVYFLIRQPLVPYWLFAVPFIFTGYVASGGGYLASTLVPPQHGPFVTAIVMLISFAFFGNPSTLLNVMDKEVGWAVMSMLCPARWAVQMSYSIAHEVSHPEPQGISRVIFMKFNQVYLRPDLDLYTVLRQDVLALVAMGFVLRVLSFLSLCLRGRAKQLW